MLTIIHIAYTRDL